MSFRKLSKLLVIALEFQEVIPNILKQIVCIFLTKLSTYNHVDEVAIPLLIMFIYII